MQWQRSGPWEGSGHSKSLYIVLCSYKTSKISSGSRINTVTSLQDRPALNWISCCSIRENSVRGKHQYHVLLTDHTKGCKIQLKISLKVSQETRICTLTQSLFTKLPVGFEPDGDPFTGLSAIGHCWTGRCRYKSPSVSLWVNPSSSLLFNFLSSRVTFGFTQHFIQFSSYSALIVKSVLCLQFSSVSKWPLWNNCLANKLGHDMLVCKANHTSHPPRNVTQISRVRVPVLPCDCCSYFLV